MIYLVIKLVTQKNIKVCVNISHSGILTINMYDFFSY